jgi:hypothetical protein
MHLAGEHGTHVPAVDALPDELLQPGAQDPADVVSVFASLSVLVYPPATLSPSSHLAQGSLRPCPKHTAREPREVENVAKRGVNGDYPGVLIFS